MDNLRFEYRVFATTLKNEQQRLAALSDHVPAELRRRISHEYYLIPRKENRFNIKIRDSKIDIKYLVQTVDACEQWQPRIKIDFPLDVKNIKKEIFPALHIDPDTENRETFSTRQLIDLITAQPTVRVVKVKKMRRAYTVRHVRCEFASLNLEKIRTTTICAESENLAQLKQVIDEIGIAKYENTNYIKAIKNILHI